MCLSVNNSVEIIKEILNERKLKLSVGESCTGGLISSSLTDIDGAANFIEINFVTYSEFAKMRFLHVPKTVIDRFGVVSIETAKHMATGLLLYSGVSISTTGYAGDNNNDEKNPKGTVYYAFGYKDKLEANKYISKKKSRIEIKKDMKNHILDEFVKFLEKNVKKK